MQWRGLYEDSGQLAESAIAELERGSAPWFASMTTLAMNSVRRIQLDKAREVCASLTAWGAQNEWTDAFVEAAIRTGLQAYIGGQYQNANELITLLGRLRADATRWEPRTQAFIEVLAASRATLAWHYDETIQHSLAAARLFEQVGDIRTAAGQRLDAAFTLVDTGQTEKAADICKNIIVAADRLAIPRLHSIAKAMLGAARLVEGRTDEALDILLDAKNRLDGLGDARNGGGVRYKIGRCYRLRKEFNLAEAVLDEGEKMLAELPRLRAMCHANKALLYVDMGRTAEALDHALKGMKLLAELGRIGTDEILVRYAYVECLRNNGRRDDAAKELALAKERVLWMADRLKDEAVQRAFLTNVDENRKVLAMQE
jgi:tetratricopeptide (TPR) repeat protein